MAYRTFIAAFTAVFALGVTAPVAALADDSALAAFEKPVSNRDLGEVNGMGKDTGVLLVLNEPGVLSEALPDELSAPEIIPADTYSAGSPYPEILPPTAYESLASVGGSAAGAVNTAQGAIMGALFGAE